MSLVIRLTRMGKRGERRYRLVLSEKRSRRDGKPVETLGWYEKGKSGKQVINKERIQFWLSQGAKASPTVNKIINS